MLATPWGCHICFIIPKNTPLTPGHPKSLTSYKTHLGSVISEQHVDRADHVGIYYMYLFYPSWTVPTISTGLRFYFFPWIETLAHVVLNNKIIPLLKAAFCWGLEILSPRAGILKAWRPQQYSLIGNHETAPWQRVLIRRLLDSGC